MPVPLSFLLSNDITAFIPPKSLSVRNEPLCFLFSPRSQALPGNAHLKALPYSNERYPFTLYLLPLSKSTREERESDFSRPIFLFKCPKKYSFKTVFLDTLVFTLFAGNCQGCQTSAKPVRGQQSTLTDVPLQSEVIYLTGLCTWLHLWRPNKLFLRYFFTFLQVWENSSKNVAESTGY